MAIKQGIDKNGKSIKVGSKVFIVGSSEDCTKVFFADKMHDFLNDRKIYTIAQIDSAGSGYTVLVKENTWCWDTKNISLAGANAIKTKPVLFETELLDI